MINEIIQGDALTKLKELESESVDCCITSPPYWALRDYKTEGIIWDAVNGCAHEWNNRDFKLHSGRGDATKAHEKYSGLPHIKDTELTDSFCSKCNAWKGSLGLEPTFDLYIKHLIQIFNEVKRVLKKSGACWVNMGDTYNTKPNNPNPVRNYISANTIQSRADANRNRVMQQLPEKSLCLIPQRFQIAMVENQWICRNTIVWWKPNCMPSSARDRFTVDFEYLFFFVKNPRYYFETQYEQVQQSSIERYDRGININNKWGEMSRNDKTIQPIIRIDYNERMKENIDLGRIKRCVWKIPTQPFSDAHFAVFPPAIVETPLKATCPQWICRKCGKPREKITDKGDLILETDKKPYPRQKTDDYEYHKWSDMARYNTKMVCGAHYEYKETGLTDCGCNAGFDGGIVLDPFIGSGTVALVAMQNARNFVGIELNPDYIKMAMERLEPYLKQERITAYE